MSERPSRLRSRQAARSAASRKAALTRKRMLAARLAALTDPAAPPLSTLLETGLDPGPIARGPGPFSPREILDRIRARASAEARDGSP